MGVETCPAGRGLPPISSARCASRLGPSFRSLIRISQWKQQDYELKLADTRHALEAQASGSPQVSTFCSACSGAKFLEVRYKGVAPVLIDMPGRH